MKTLLTLFVLFFSFPSWAEWVYFQTNTSGYEMHYDSETINKDQGYIYFWQLNNYGKKDKHGDMSAIFYNQLDCSIVKYKWINLKFYDQPMGKGNLNADFTHDEWQFPKSGSIGNNLINHICDKYN